MTVQDTIDGLRVAYPQIEEAQALIYFRQVHREILAQAQIETKEQQIDLTQGQREYALDQIAVVRAAYLVKSASDIKMLTPTSTDWLEEHRPIWRATQEQGEPTHFYIEDGNIGLDPNPDTTTTAGFPKLLVYGTDNQALIITDDIPVAIPSIRVYIEGMKRLYASDRDPARFDQWDKTYQNELHKTLATINATTEDLDAPRLVPAWMKNVRVE